MIKSSFSFLKWTPMVALLAMAFTLSMHSSTSGKELLDEVDTPIRVDLTSEERILGKYVDDLVDYEHECRLLGLRPRLASADLNGVERRATELRDRLSEVQGALREAVRKLKAANEWETLNTTIAARITDPNERKQFEELNLKQLLDDGSNTLTNHSSEISAPLDNLRKRSSSRNLLQYRDGALAFVPAAYHPPTPPMLLVSVKCLIAGARRGLVGAMGNKSNAHSTDVWSCACHPGQANGDGTGAACSQCC
jgi:hypothetical protein